LHGIEFLKKEHTPTDSSRDGEKTFGVFFWKEHSPTDWKRKLWVVSMQKLCLERKHHGRFNKKLFGREKEFDHWGAWEHDFPAVFGDDTKDVLPSRGSFLETLAR
jgi:hypothetical protein